MATLGGRVWYGAVCTREHESCRDHSRSHPGSNPFHTVATQSSIVALNHNSVALHFVPLAEHPAASAPSDMEADIVKLQDPLEMPC